MPEILHSLLLGGIGLFLLRMGWEMEALIREGEKGRLLAWLEQKQRNYLTRRQHAAAAADKILESNRRIARHFRRFPVVHKIVLYTIVLAWGFFGIYFCFMAVRVFYMAYSLD